MLGAGAIGGLFADALTRVDCDVTLLLRDPAPPGYRELIVERDGQREQRRVAVSSPSHCRDVSRVLLTTKAYDAVTALQALQPAMAEDCTVLVMVNGMGIVESLRDSFPNARLYAATTTQGAYRTGHLSLRHAGFGTTRVGSPENNRLPGWFDNFSRALPPCDWDDEINTALWAKLAVNCVINPLTAVHRCRNGELARDRALRDEVALLCREVAQVSYAAGYTQTAQNISEQAAQVIADTATNRSSMLQDVLADRPTEAPHITGYLLRVAEDHGIPAPRNRALLEAVLAFGKAR